MNGQQLAEEVRVKSAAWRAGKITNSDFEEFMDRAEEQKRLIDAGPFRSWGDSAAGSGVTTKALGAGAVHGKKWEPPSPLHAGEVQWKSLFAAARSRMPYSTHIGDPRGEMQLHTKAAVGEGAPGTLLPPILMPEAFSLLYEPDRLFEAFPGAAAETQSVSYLQHVGNTNPAAAVPELAQKPDLGMQVEPKTVSFTTVAALATFSRQLLDDFQDFYSFVPREMAAAVIDEETNQIINGDGTGADITGILNTSGVLTRAMGTDTPINALVKSFNDLRVGSSYATADLVAMHPSTWTHVKTQTDTQGRYLLNINADDVAAVNNIFGVRVLSNTKIPIGTAVTFDTTIAVRAWTRMGLEMMTNPYGDSEFSTNAISFRCEERITIGVVRPTAICVVTGLGS